MLGVLGTLQESGWSPGPRRVWTRRLWVQTGGCSPEGLRSSAVGDGQGVPMATVQGTLALECPALQLYARAGALRLGTV